MTQHLSEDETLAAVPPLTRTRLTAWIAAEVVTPEHTPGGPAFRDLDVARLALACELADAYDLAADALALVLTLVDRLHRAEADLATLSRALAAEPEDIRRRVGAGLRR
ncbi:MAG: hypothetical protein GC186_10410 [Rhodobacteraceae bacterium]|nr:hypothetical protein [Paracoccaceae bacterium]